MGAAGLRGAAPRAAGAEGEDCRLAQQSIWENVPGGGLERNTACSPQGGPVLVGGGWRARAGPRGKRNCRARSGSTVRVLAGAAGVAEACEGTFLPLPAPPWG